MNKKLPVSITGAALVVALACIVSAVASQAKARKSAKELHALRAQIARMKAFVPGVGTPIYTPGEPPATNAVALVEHSTAPRGPRDDEAADPQQRSRPSRESFEDRMANMKAEDPEGYAEMIRRREEAQQMMRYGLAERTATFLDLDTSGMTEQERANHERLVTKMANIWELSAKFQDPEAAPDREAMRELFIEMREVRPLLDLERTAMFKQLGFELGYEGEDADVFAAHAEEIISATSLQMPDGRGGQGGGRGPAGGGR
ncbi:hypothetical protein [Pontiella sp.]|uniref:hypothetical protein n=1 Tax=Pontiella sp. TaxID=2837462 RepID=UPI0035699BC5